MELPLKFHPYRNGIHENIGNLRDANNKVIACYVNRINAEKIISLVNKPRKRKGER
jgi:hypothetical protein